MALAQIQEIKRLKLPAHSAELGRFLLAELASIQNSKFKTQSSVRGLGLMAGIELNLPGGKPATHVALDAIKRLLQRGYIFLPEGEHANVISFTPPLTISRAQLSRAITELKKVLATD
jgi:4-aminobutyrate aminotransferase-like enzyme